MDKVTAVASLIRVQVVVDHKMPTPKHNRVKDLALIFWSVSLYTSLFTIKTIFTLSRLHLLSKTSRVSVFLRKFFTHSFNEMFIVHGISHCCNDTYWCQVYIVGNKEYLRRIHIIFMLLQSAFHYLFPVKFSLKLVTFSNSYARKQKCMFFFLKTV